MRSKIFPKLIIAFLFFSFLSFGFLNLAKGAESSGKIFVLRLLYNRGDISLIDISTKEGYPSLSTARTGKDYECFVLSFSNQTLYSFKFAIPREIVTAGARGSALLDEIRFALLIPYFKDAKVIHIYQSNNLKLAVDVSRLSEISQKTNSNWVLIGIFLILFFAAAIILYSFFRQKKSKIPAMPTTGIPAPR